MNNHPEAGFSPGLAPRAENEYAIALSDMSQNYWQSRNNGSYYDKAARKNVQTNQAYTGGFAGVAAMYVAHHRAVGGGAAKAALSRAQTQTAAGDPLSALQKVQALLQANPGDPDLLSARAQAFLGLGDIADARADYTNVLTRRQTAADYVGRARAAARMGDAARVKKDLDEAARLDSSAASAARSEIDAALAANRAPADPQALWSQLENQARSGSPASALHGTAMAVLRAIGAVRIRYDERYQDGLAPLEAAVRARPNDPDRQIALARYLRDGTDVLEEQVGPRDEPRLYRVQSDGRPPARHRPRRADG